MLYLAVVAYGETVLVQHTEHAGNFKVVIHDGVLSHINTAEKYASYKYFAHRVDVLVSDEDLTFLVVCNPAYPQFLSFKFLEELWTRFKGHYTDVDYRSVLTMELQQDFAPFAESLVQRYAGLDTTRMKKPSQYVEKPVSDLSHYLNRGIRQPLLVQGKSAGEGERGLGLLAENGRRTSRLYTALALFFGLVVAFVIFWVVVVVPSCGWYLQDIQNKNSKCWLTFGGGNSGGR